MDPSTRDKLARAGISTLTTALFRRGLRSVWLNGLLPVAAAQPRMVGPAYTLRFIPAREDIGGIATYGAGPNLHQRAFEECPGGHVLVMDTHNETRACSCGDLLIARLQHRGAAGIVTDGGFRDSDGVATLGFPAYQRARVPAPSFLHLQAADLQTPIHCAGVAIYPGDIMVGDKEGVIVIPAALAAEIAEEADHLARYDDFALAQIKAGRAIPGLYPATDTTRAEFQAWEKSQ